MATIHKLCDARSLTPDSGEFAGRYEVVVRDEQWTPATPDYEFHRVTVNVVNDPGDEDDGPSAQSLSPAAAGILKLSQEPADPERRFAPWST